MKRDEIKFFLLLFLTRMHIVYSFKIWSLQKDTKFKPAKQKGNLNTVAAKRSAKINRSLGKGNLQDISSDNLIWKLNLTVTGLYIISINRKIL